MPQVRLQRQETAAEAYDDEEQKQVILGKLMEQMDVTPGESRGEATVRFVTFQESLSDDEIVDMRGSDTPRDQQREQNLLLHLLQVRGTIDGSGRLAHWN